jgi:hypothetical protein
MVIKSLDIGSHANNCSGIYRNVPFSVASFFTDLKAGSPKSEYTPWPPLAHLVV